MSYDLYALAEKMERALRQAAILRTESVCLDLWAPEARDLLTLLRHHIERIDPAGQGTGEANPNPQQGKTL